MLDDKKIGALCYNLVKKEFFFHEYCPSTPMYYGKIYFQLNDDNPQPSIFVTFLSNDIFKHHTIKQPFWLECDVYFQQRLLKYDSSSNDTSINSESRIDIESDSEKENDGDKENDGKIQGDTKIATIKNKFNSKKQQYYNYKAAMGSKELLKLLTESHNNSNNNNQFSIDFVKEDMKDMFEIFWKKRTQRVEAIKLQLVKCPPAAFNYKTKEEQARDIF